MISPAHGMEAGVGDNLVAIVATIGAFVLVGFFWFSVIRAQIRARELLHAERLMALEKGLPPPTEPPNGGGKPENDGKKAPAHPLKMGIFWSFLGLGIILSMRIADPGSSRWAWGIIVLAMGLADLVYWFVRGKAETEGTRQDPGGH
jgi:hypothetical protein